MADADIVQKVVVCGAAASTCAGVTMLNGSKCSGQSEVMP